MKTKFSRLSQDHDALPVCTKQAMAAAECNSRLLKLAVDRAIHRQASAWGIRADQAQALLLDRRAVA